MDLGFLHSHHLIVVLYIILMALHLFFLFTKNHHAFTTFRLKVKWFRMGLEILMVLTGGFLLYRAPDGLALYNIVKLGAVVGAIGVTVVGFKKYNAPFILLGIILMGYAYGVAKVRSPLFIPEASRVASAHNQQTNIHDQGKAIYTIACQRCHGADGDAQYRKAKSLAQSQMGDDYKRGVIQNGINTMPKFDYLDENQREAVLTYINTLKK